MTRKLKFTKMVAAGNDFIVLDNRVYRISSKKSLADLSRRVCHRTSGIGADGLLVVERSAKADIRMRIFNADGSEAEMCGNGSRCFALWCARQKKRASLDLRIQTLAGIIRAHVRKDQVRVNLTEPKGLRLGVPVAGLKGPKGRTLKVDFIDSGVPHAVVFVQDTGMIDVNALGRQIRYNKAFAPRGTNVNFVQLLGSRSIRIRTYERGVEAETLACGTGSVASALITGYRAGCTGGQQFDVHTAGGQVLKIYFTLESGRLSDVWLEGKAEVICEGDYYV